MNINSEISLLELRLKRHIRDFNIFDIEEITDIPRNDLVYFMLGEKNWPTEKIIDCARMLNMI